MQKFILEKKDDLQRLFILICSIVIVLNKNIFSHWTHSADQDFTLIYNALIINSGYKPEYFDHPGYTQILLLSLLFDFLKFFGINSINQINDLHDNFLIKDFNNLFVAGRILNIGLIFFIGITFKNILNKISDNKLLNLSLVILYLISSINFASSVIRTELISILFFLLSIFFFINFIKKNILSRKDLFFIGLFLTLAIFSKIQLIFIFPLFVFIFFALYQSESTTNEKKLNYKLYIFPSLIFFLTNLAIYYFSEGIFNQLLVWIFVLILFLFIFFISKLKFRSNYFLPYIFIYFLLGVLFSVMFLILYKPFSFFYFKVLINFPGWITMFSIKTDPFVISNKSYYIIIQNFFDNYLIYLKKVYFYYPLEFLLLLMSVALIFFINLKKRDRKYLIYIFNFCFFIIVCFFFSFRVSTNYIMMSSLVLVLNISFAFTLIERTVVRKFNIIGIIFLIFIIIFYIPNNIYKIYNYKYIINYNTSSYTNICNNVSILNPDSFIRIWHKKIDDKLLKKLCVKI